MDVIKEFMNKERLYIPSYLAAPYTIGKTSHNQMVDDSYIIILL